MTFFIVYYIYVQNNFQNTPYIILKWVQTLNPQPVPNPKPAPNPNPKPVLNPKPYTGFKL